MTKGWVWGETSGATPTLPQRESPGHELALGRADAIHGDVAGKLLHFLCVVCFTKSLVMGKNMKLFMLLFYQGLFSSVTVAAKSSDWAWKPFGCWSGSSRVWCLIGQTKTKDSPPTGVVSSSIKEWEEAIRGLEAGPLFDEEVIYVMCHANAKEHGQRSNKDATSAWVKKTTTRRWWGRSMALTKCFTSRA